jgi:hypothetical protein
MAQVYVSSTYSDLRECRSQVSVRLRKLDHKDVAMEYYSAKGQRPVKKCLADVAACDLYIGIFAWRYGSVPKKNNPKRLSITEMEYRQAKRLRKECLIFLVDDKASWPVEFIDKNRARIEKLRQELCDEHCVAFFTSCDSLDSEVNTAVTGWDKRQGTGTPPRPPRLNRAIYYDIVAKRHQHLSLTALTPADKDEFLQLQLRSIFIEQNVRTNPPPVELPSALWEKLERGHELHPEELPAGITSNDVDRARAAYYTKPAWPVLDAITGSRKQQVILGSPGSGKSTLARYILLSLVSKSGDEKLRRKMKGFLPFLIELRSYVLLSEKNKCNNFLGFLKTIGEAENWELDDGELRRYLRDDGRAIIIFDGLDEIFDTEARERIKHQIVSFTCAYPKVRVIVTSRITGYWPGILMDAGFEHFTLQDLEEKQVATFVNSWYSLALKDRPEEAEDCSARIMHLFNEFSPIRQLASNPMLLTMMAIIGRHQELPRERKDLYYHTTNVLIHLWDVNKHLEDRRVPAALIDKEDKKELLRRLAYKMQQDARHRKAVNYIHREELQAQFKKYLEERYEERPGQAAMIARAMIDQFRERNFILALYGVDLYGFVHRAFLDYFCARAIVRKFEKSRDIKPEELTRKIYGAHWKDPLWHEALSLICGMVDEKFARSVIDHLIKVYPPSSSLEERKWNWNIALAAKCLSQLRNLNPVAESASQSLKAVCSLFDLYMKDFDLRRSMSLVDRRITFLDEQILRPLEAISLTWPYPAALIDWLRKLQPFESINLFGEMLGRFAGAVGKGHDDVRQIMLDWAKRGEDSHRVLALHALGIGWQDHPETLSLLSSSAVNDITPCVRNAAVRLLGRCFRDSPRILPLLRKIAVKDAHVSVRSAAVWTLVEYFRDDKDTLPLLRRIAIEDMGRDMHWSVRRMAVEALRQHFPADASTLRLYRDLVVNHRKWSVRSATVWALTMLYRKNKGTPGLLRRCAIEDKNADVRGAAVRALGEHFQDNAQTLPLLCMCAVKDKDGNVRRVAVRALGRHFKDAASALRAARERAFNDPDVDVRNAASWALS